MLIRLLSHHCSDPMMQTCKLRTTIVRVVVGIPIRGLEFEVLTHFVYQSAVITRNKTTIQRILDDTEQF